MACLHSGLKFYESIYYIFNPELKKKKDRKYILLGCVDPLQCVHLQNLFIPAASLRNTYWTRINETKLGSFSLEKT